MHWQHGMLDFFQKLLKLSESIDPLHMHTAEKSTNDNTHFCSIAVIQPNITSQQNYFCGIFEMVSNEPLCDINEKRKILDIKQIGEVFPQAILVKTEKPIVFKFFTMNSLLLGFNS